MFTDLYSKTFSIHLKISEGKSENFLIFSSPGKWIISKYTCLSERIEKDA